MENVIRYCGECCKILWRMLYDNVENVIRYYGECYGEWYKMLWRML